MFHLFTINSIVFFSLPFSYIEIFKSNYADARASILNDTQVSLKQKVNYNDQRSNNYSPNDSNDTHSMNFGYNSRNTNQYSSSLPPPPPPPPSQSQSLTSPPTYYNPYSSTTNSYSTSTPTPPVQGTLKRKLIFSDKVLQSYS